MKKSITLLLIFVVTTTLCAQQKHQKFGKIKISDLEMTTYDKDTTANAVVLFNYGEAYFKVNSSGYGNDLYQEFHIRIKILNKEGFKWANEEIFFHKYQYVTKFKASSYNLENGKIVEKKVKKRDVFEESFNKIFFLKKFTFPDVKEGTIIEYKYTTISRSFLNLISWQFQYEIPVIYNDYEIKVPSFFTHRKVLKGYVPCSDYRKTTVVDAYSFGYFSNNKRVTEFDVYKYVFEAIPAFIPEPYINSKKNYISSLVFEWYRAANNTTNSWEIISKGLIDSDYFGRRIICPPSVKKELKAEVESKDNKYDKMVVIYEWIKNSMSWDNSTGYQLDLGIAHAFNQKTGSVADINLLLIATLKEFGIRAIPVIISTRENGFVNPAYPSISDFNYVIAYVKIDDKIYYLDATEKYCPAGLLPERCLNGIGRAIYQPTFEVDLTNTEKSENINYITATIENSQLVGNYAGVAKNYAALEIRNQYTNATTEDAFLEKMESQNNGMTVSDFEIINLDNIYEALKIKYNLKISNQADILGDKIYINPMLFWGMENNPFKIEKREYPVDFAYQSSERYVLNFTIPEGYKVESIPESKNIEMEGKVAEFQYNVVHSGNIIQVSSKININKTIFTQIEYPTLKIFFSEIVSKHAERIVLTKE